MRKNIIFTSNGIVGTNFSQKFIEDNLKNKSVIVIDNGTYNTTNYNDRQKNVDMFIKYGVKKVDLVTLDNNTEQILNYDVCYIMGGSIANLVILVNTTNIRSVLKQFLINGIYIGESAGGIILDKDVEWYFKLKRGTKPKYDVVFDSYQGLEFINKHIYPHYDKENVDGINKINNYPEEITPLIDGDYIEINYN